MSEKIQRFKQKRIEAKAIREASKKEETATPENPIKRRVYSKGDGMTKEKARLRDGLRGTIGEPSPEARQKPFKVPPFGILKPSPIDGTPIGRVFPRKDRDGSHLIPEKFRPLELNAHKFNRAYKRALKAGEPWAQKLEKFVERKFQNMAGIKVGYDKPLSERIKDLADQGQDWAIVWSMQNRKESPVVSLPFPKFPPKEPTEGINPPPNWRGGVVRLPEQDHVVTFDPATGQATCGGPVRTPELEKAPERILYAQAAVDKKTED